MSFVLSYGSSFILLELSKNLLCLPFITNALLYEVNHYGGGGGGSPTYQPLLSGLHTEKWERSGLQKQNKGMTSPAMRSTNTVSLRY
jgi:hypothetical protein